MSIFTLSNGRPPKFPSQFVERFLRYFSPGDCSCSTISHDAFKVKLSMIKKTNRLDISFCVENKHKVMHRWPRYKISLLAAGFCKHRQFAKIQHLSESPHSPTVKLTVSTTSREQVRLQCVFLFCFFYTICYCRGSQLLRPSLVHLFTGWLASFLSLGRLREMTTHGL